MVTKRDQTRPVGQVGFMVKELAGLGGRPFGHAADADTAARAAVAGAKSARRRRRPCASRRPPSKEPWLTCRQGVDTVPGRRSRIEERTSPPRNTAAPCRHVSPTCARWCPVRDPGSVRRVRLTARRSGIAGCSSVSHSRPARSHLPRFLTCGGPTPYKASQVVTASGRPFTLSLIHI